MRSGAIHDVIRERPLDFQGGGGGGLVRLEYFCYMFSETEKYFQHHFFFKCMMREVICVYCTDRMNNDMY